MIVLRGIGVSPGISISKAYVYTPSDIDVPKYKIEDPRKEVERFIKALEKAKEDLLKIKDKIEKSSIEHANIFIAHTMILDDPEIRKEISLLIEKENVNAEYAIKTITDNLIEELASIDDPIIRDRIIDLKDIRNRVLSILLGKGEKGIRTKEQKILVAYDLNPSDTANLDKNYIVGIAIELGGPTSHTSIIARSLRIPAVVKVQNLIASTKPKDTIIIDGKEGLVIIKPNEETLKKYTRLKEEYEELRKILLTTIQLPAKTKDGIYINILGNADIEDEIGTIYEHGGRGIGLLRTEVLFLKKHKAPTEEEQFKLYKKILEVSSPYPVTIRTADIGGDKLPKFISMKKESNPFLGWRGIRFSLDEGNLFKTQLRALYRASIYGNLKIMFPMITNIEEIRRIKETIKNIKSELRSEGFSIKEDVPIGVMIEVPAAALIVEHIVKEVDFVSIGTNDLVQYTLAVDRGNDLVAHIYDPFHPAILKLIKNISIASKLEGIEVSVCGEVAGDINYIPILIGLGIETLSITPLFIPEVKELIRKISQSESKELTEELLEYESSEKIYKRIKQFIDDLKIQKK